MYKPGDLEVGKYDYDTREDNYDGGTGVFLPHSCNEWVIGGKEQVEQLIVDLQKALTYLN